MKNLKIFLTNLLVCLTLIGCPTPDEEGTNDQGIVGSGPAHVEEAKPDEGTPPDAPKVMLFANKEAFQKMLKDANCVKIQGYNEVNALKLESAAFAVAREELGGLNFFDTPRCWLLTTDKFTNADNVELGDEQEIELSATKSKVECKITYLSPGFPQIPATLIP